MCDISLLLHKPGNEVSFGSEHDFIQKYLNTYKNEMLVEHGSNDTRKNERLDFIGAQPISMRLNHIDRIREDKDGEFSYIVCEKTDGVRYIMVITNTGYCYLTGRNTTQSTENRYKLNEIKVELSKKLFIDDEDDDEEEISIVEIFDGELVLDKKGDKYFLKFLVFDCLVHFGEKIFTMPYLDRLTNALYFMQYNNICFETNDEIPPVPKSFTQTKGMAIATCITTGVTDNFEESENDIVISICVKDFFKFKYCNYLFDNYIPTLPHHNDGLIFTKNGSKYKPGTDENIIKWKPPSMNTIDFLLVANTDNIIVTLNNDTSFESRVLDLYVMDQNQERKEYETVFFDFMIVDQEFFEEVLQKTQEKQEAEGAKGIVAECKWVELGQGKGELLKKIYNNDTDLILQCPEFPSDSNQDDVRKWVVELKKTYRENQYSKGWGFDRYRLDKNFSNNKKIAKDIVSSIKENLDSNKLMSLLNPTNQIQHPNPHANGANQEPSVQKKIKKN